MYDQRLCYLYVSVLAREGRANLVQELKGHEYDLDELEAVLERAGSEEGLAYVQERKGKYKEALGNYLLSLKQYLQAAISSTKSANTYSEGWEYSSIARLLPAERQVQPGVPGVPPGAAGHGRPRRGCVVYF